MPHHVTQRGNRRQETFFRDDDYQAYLGRALGDDDFQKRLEKKLGRVLRRQKPGPKKTG